MKQKSSTKADSGFVRKNSSNAMLADVRSNKENPIFKEGYIFKVEVYDFDSPEMKKEIENAHKEQQAILDRMKVDYDSLKKTCDI